MTSFKEQTFTKRFDFPVWKKLFSYAKTYRKTFIMLIMVMVLAGFVDVIMPLITRYAIDNFIEQKSTEGIEIFILIYLGICLFQGFNVFMLITLAGRIEVGVCYKIRKVVFEHLQKLSFSFYDKTPLGWIMARMLSDIRHIAGILAWGLVDSTWGIVMMLSIAIIMLVLNTKLALIALIVIPILVTTSLYFQKRILKWQRVVKKTNSKITGSFNEGIHGAKTSKTLVIEEDNIKDFNSLTQDMFSSSVKSAVFSAAFMPIVSFLSAIGSVLIIWYGGNSVIEGTMSYGTLVAFFNYSIIFFMPVMDLARVFTNFQQAQAGAERITSLLDTKPDIKDSKEVIEKDGDILDKMPKFKDSIRGNVTFENVDFHYVSEEPILTNFNLEIKAGETIALVGETGSGKSTIVNLVCRFYEPIKGRILIDGEDISKRGLKWLHSHLGYVLQSPQLFSGSVLDNVRYGRLDASMEEVIEACKLVNAHEFILKMENGYNTPVGEGGSKLSTGEKQLISFARALIANPAIFVLDEATSSVDTETEASIQYAINKLLDNRTSFIIAHRLSTIRDADKILLIDNGSITECGSHDQLMDLKGAYYTLFTNQFIKEKEKSLI